jgi:endonuclease YncB( thermonuclease family)
MKSSVSAMCRKCWLGFRLVFGLVIIVTALACAVPFYSAAPAAITCADCPLIPVDWVIDGDTFDSVLGRVRLYGVDAPERGEECFSEATDRLKELAGGWVKVELGPRRMDQFGRALAYLYTETGDSLEETLVREGLARAWTGDGQHRDVLMALEREARQQGSGCLW